MIKLKTTLLAALWGEQLNDSGFRTREGQGSRPDATAWAILASQAAGVKAAQLNPARFLLAGAQLPDGRVSVSSDHPESCWPTALSILAWHQTPEFHAAQVRAVNFLLNSMGRRFPKQADAPYDHDPTLKGWPWIEDTFSWVIPSGLAVIALKAAGHAQHERVQDAIRLLLDRQLPHGGWNYGNTRVYGQELNPMIEPTGMALQALAGSIERQEIEQSLRYLNKSIARTKTPISLSWSLLGLGTWGEVSFERESWLEACWQRQTRYSAYDRVALSHLILALSLPKGILSLFNRPD